MQPVSLCRGGQDLPSTHPYPKLIGCHQDTARWVPTWACAPHGGPDGGFSSPVSGAQDHHLPPTPDPMVTSALLFSGPPWGVVLVIPSAVKHSELGIRAAQGPRLAQEEREARERALLVGGTGAEPGPPAPPGPLPAPISPARDSAAETKASLHQGPIKAQLEALRAPGAVGLRGPCQASPLHTPPRSATRPEERSGRTPP